MPELLVLKGIHKYFGNAHVLKNINLSIREAEVHGIIGPNAAGKSVLLNIISGLYPFSAGEMFLSGEPVHLPSRQASQGQGIYYLSSSEHFIDNFSVAENIYYNFDSPQKKFVHYREINESISAFLKGFSYEVDVRLPVQHLSTLDRELLKLARIIYRRPKLVILDEPFYTASLDIKPRLKKMIDYLRDHGSAVLYVSHRLSDLHEFCDRVTIIRDGCNIKTMEVSDQTISEIVELMYISNEKKSFPKIISNNQRKMLSLRGVSTNRHLSNISFDLYKGEVLGFFGLFGSGRTAVARAIFGLDSLQSGEIYLNGARFHNPTSTKAIKMGIGYIPANFFTEGLFSKLSVIENITAVKLDKISKHLFVDKNIEFEVAREFINKLDINTPSIRSLPREISSGNQHKLLLAKWIFADCRILIFDEPTKGLDENSRTDFYNYLNKFTADGSSAIFISSDIDELFGMCDRIVVLCDGQIAGIVPRSEFPKKSIISKALGVQL